MVWDLKLKKNVNQFIDFLSKNNIESRPFFEPLSGTVAFKKKRKSFKIYHQNKVSKDISRRSINIPSSIHLTESDIKKISKKIIKFLLNE
jgi:dTDP-4-amino-4,6-dideoxygalactose transaminase